MTDTERLDWIERTPASVLTNLLGVTPVWRVRWVNPDAADIETTSRPSLREAIDAAMESTAEAKP